MKTQNIPYVHKRTPLWSETDAAQIIYTVRFVDYAMEAIEGWFRNVMKLDWFRMNTELDMGTPFVKIDMDIKTPLVPYDELEVCVLVEKMGRSSLTFNVIGRRNGEEISFESRFVCSMVRKSTMQSIVIPEEQRENVNNYIQECAAVLGSDTEEVVGISK